MVKQCIIKCSAVMAMLTVSLFHLTLVCSVHSFADLIIYNNGAENRSYGWGFEFY